MEKRRQLKTRSSHWAINSAKYLATKNITPNQISLFSIAMAFIAAFFLSFWLHTPVWVQFLSLIMIIAGIQGRLFCNLLDGMVAIEGGKKTPAGEIFNELPDRISDSLIFMGLGMGLSLPYAFELGMFAALFAVFTAYIRLLGISMGTPAFFSGPMAKQHRMALLTGSCLLTMLSLFWGGTEWFLYLALIVLNLGTIITCVNRVQKIIHFVNNDSGSYE